MGEFTRNIQRLKKKTSDYISKGLEKQREYDRGLQSKRDVTDIKEEQTERKRTRVNKPIGPISSPARKAVNSKSTAPKAPAAPKNKPSTPATKKKANASGTFSFTKKGNKALKDVKPAGLKQGPTQANADAAAVIKGKPGGKASKRNPQARKARNAERLKGIQEAATSAGTKKKAPTTKKAPAKKEAAPKKKSGVQLMNPKAAKIVREARMKHAVEAGRKKRGAAAKPMKRSTTTKKSTGRRMSAVDKAKGHFA